MGGYFWLIDKIALNVLEDGYIITIPHGRSRTGVVYGYNGITVNLKNLTCYFPKFIKVQSKSSGGGLSERKDYLGLEER